MTTAVNNPRSRRIVQFIDISIFSEKYGIITLRLYDFHIVDPKNNKVN